MQCPSVADREMDRIVTSTNGEVMWLTAFIYSCWFASRITQKVKGGFGWNFQGRLDLTQSTKDFPFKNGAATWRTQWKKWQSIGGGLRCPSALSVASAIAAYKMHAENVPQIKQVSSVINLRQQDWAAAHDLHHPWQPFQPERDCRSQSLTRTASHQPCIPSLNAKLCSKTKF